MTEDDIHQLLYRRESESLDFKRDQYRFVGASDVGLSVFLCVRRGRHQVSGTKRSGNRMAKWVSAACHAGAGAQRFLMFRSAR